MGMQVLLERRRRVAEQLSSRRIRLSDLRARPIDGLAEESRSELLTAIEQEAEVTLGHQLLASVVPPVTRSLSAS